MDAIHISSACISNVLECLIVGSSATSALFSFLFSFSIQISHTLYNICIIHVIVIFVLLILRKQKVKCCLNFQKYCNNINVHFYLLLYVINIFYCILFYNNFLLHMRFLKNFFSNYMFITLHTQIITMTCANFSINI